MVEARALACVSGSSIVVGDDCLIATDEFEQCY